MKKLLLSCQNALLSRLILALLLAGAGLSANADFDEGVAAYEKGDYATALREWQPLAEQGHANAQYYLGYMYIQGRGMPQDHKATAQWFRRAAEQGHVKAQYTLDSLDFIYVLQAQQDDKAAAQWYRRAAEQGNAFAQSNLGLMYAKGQGVLQDDVYAHMWANIAASGDHKDAVEFRNLVEKQMTPSQIAEAQKLARECVRKAYRDC